MRRFLKGEGSARLDAEIEQSLSTRQGLLDEAEALGEQLVKAIRDKSEVGRKTELLAAVMASLKPHEVQESYCKNGRNWPLTGCVSFRQLMAIRSARGHMGGICHEWKLNSKVRAVRFAKKLGLPTPEHFGTFAHDELSEVSQRAIKPSWGAGSKGVFLMGENEGLDVFLAERFPAGDLPERMAIIGAKRWISQELVSASADEPIPARDLKFYCFYGEVGLVLEVERYPQRRYCWWSGNGESLSTGKYERNRFEGAGFDAEALEMARTLSLAIPAPFCRIDLLKGHDRTVFGEITPRPGGFHEFDASTDFRLGKAFMQAEGRLQQDLLKGKSFHKMFSA